jgi:hypothetical protein
MFDFLVLRVVLRMKSPRPGCRREWGSSTPSRPFALCGSAASRTPAMLNQLPAIEPALCIGSCRERQDELVHDRSQTGPGSTNGAGDWLRM